MNITVGADTQRLIEYHMKRAGFASPEEVIRHALDALDGRQREGGIPSGDLEEIYPGYREKIARGIAEADAGLLTDGEAFFDDLERDNATRTKDGRKTA